MKVKLSLKLALNFVALLMLSALAILFAVLYANTFSAGFFYKHKTVLLALVTVLVAIITVISLAYLVNDNKIIYKLTVVTLFTISFALSVLYVLKITGVADKIDSVEDLRNYVASFGYLAVIIYVLINLLQVVLLPIPGVLTVGAGVALFGPLKTAVYSFIGITLGSFVAFFTGRVLGYKVVKWLIGEDTLKKWLKAIKKKDKIVLTFMFLFPFFPDDVLCFIAGLSSMSTSYFVGMIIICRLISVFASSYSLSGYVIPYNTWWGILLWGLVILLTAIVAVYLYKNGDKIQNTIINKLVKRRRKVENNTSRRS